ncbi:AAA family ATPase [Nesterenkonia lutea]|uniref:Mrp family chromosome partitioning ATPase n=1 Tax=Nesterenkonia lutea TaxID=272919 RepID=A0ABR9JEZ7_9MICC|nr:ParA family protein [Nesterenkonia lutea]MBE1524506.1 Mrp family chromosome partitioning ATPase [Nesterenkonia lutea]
MERCAVATTGQLTVDHIAAVEGLQGPVTIERRCADLPELIAVCRNGRADAALIIGDTEQLTATVLAELRQGGRRVVALCAAAEERDRLHRLGVTCFDDEVSAGDLALALQGGQSTPAARSTTEHADGASPEGAAAPGGPAPPADTVEHAGQEDGSPAVEPDALLPAEPATVTRPEGITVVWGGPGSPGRSTIALNLAAEIALQGHEVLLVDADTVAASLVPQLGLMEETAGLAQACRAADLGRLDAAALGAAVAVVEVSGSRFGLLSGLPRAARWPEIRERSLIAVLEMARARYDHVIVDIAASVEQDEELSYDTIAPQRSGAALTCLRAADRILAVGAADPVSFSRLVKAIEDLQLSLPETAAAQIEVVINKVRSEVIGRSPRDQLQRTWRQLGPDRGIDAFLTWDGAGCDAALLKGQVLAEAAPDSALRRSIADLAGAELPQRRTGLMSRFRR